MDLMFAAFVAKLKESPMQISNLGLTFDVRAALASRRALDEAKRWFNSQSDRTHAQRGHIGISCNEPADHRGRGREKNGQQNGQP
jgi:hypothetical protein